MRISDWSSDVCSSDLVHLSEYARPGVRKILKPVLEILAGIPSVVLGFFALQFISPEIVQRFFEDANQFNIMAAGIGVGILTVPLVASISEDALRSVPQSLREASYGMRSAERRVGKAGVSTGRYRWARAS